MGMGFPFGSARRSGACPDRNPSPVAVTTPRKGDPIPARFEIIRTYKRGAFTVAEIVWPDAKNYDGRKIALYRCELKWLAAADELDPHFAETRGPLVPIARFEPTAQGWKMAVACARAADNEEKGRR